MEKITVLYLAPVQPQLESGVQFSAPGFKENSFGQGPKELMLKTKGFEDAA